MYILLSGSPISSGTATYLGALHNFYFLLRQAIQTIHQLVYRCLQSQRVRFRVGFLALIGVLAHKMRRNEWLDLSTRSAVAIGEDANSGRKTNCARIKLFQAIKFIHLPVRRIRNNIVTDHIKCPYIPNDVFPKIALP